MSYRWIPFVSARSRRRRIETGIVASATNDSCKLVFLAEKEAARMADTSVAHMTYLGAHDETQPVSGSRPKPE